MNENASSILSKALIYFIIALLALLGLIALTLISGVVQVEVTTTGVEVDPYHVKIQTMIREGDFAGIEQEISKNPMVVNYTKDDLKSFLDAAVVFQQDKIVRLLLENGADPNLTGPDPLMFAVCGNDEEMARQLLEYGADPLLYCPSLRMTPLEAANDDSTMHELLLKYAKDGTTQADQARDN